MDHSSHEGHGSGATATPAAETGKHCPMIMVFHGGHCERILWNGWVASTLTEFLLSALAIFLVAFLFEALKFVREYLLRKEARKVAEQFAADMRKANRSVCPGTSCSETTLADYEPKSYWERIFGYPHLAQTILNALQIVISYVLMLIFMTYNYWLCLATVLGLAFGYFFFGWAKKDITESECCP